MKCISKKIHIIAFQALSDDIFTIKTKYKLAVELLNEIKLQVPELLEH